MRQEFDSEVPVEVLIPYPGNPRKGDVPAIKESIKTNGFYGTILVQMGTRYVVGGNSRLHAVRELGLRTVPVMWLDIDEKQAKRILLVDNRLPDMATYDTDLLATLLQDMADSDSLDGTGYDADYLDDLLGRIEVELEPVPFEGGYIETPEEVEERQAIGGITKASQGLREVVLVYPEDEYQLFVSCLSKLRTAYGSDTTSSTILEALTEASQRLS